VDGEARADRTGVGGNDRERGIGRRRAAATALATVLPLLTVATVETAAPPWRAIPSELWGVVPLWIGAWVVLPVLGGWGLRTWTWPALCLAMPVLALMASYGWVPPPAGGPGSPVPSPSDPSLALPVGVFIAVGLVAAVCASAGTAAGLAGRRPPPARHPVWRVLAVAAVLPLVVATTVVVLVPASWHNGWLGMLLATGMAAAWLVAPAVVGFAQRGWWWPPAVLLATLAALVSWSVPWTLGVPYRFHATSWAELVVLVYGAIVAVTATIAAVVGVAAGRSVGRRGSVAGADQGRDNPVGAAHDPPVASVAQRNRSKGPPPA
jgi:hypothetical protein